ncbi:MAG: HEAT repeat domain-containing protein [Pseudomonadota bacterium]
MVGGSEAGTPDALLLMTGGCPHCPAVLQALTGLLKEGVIGRLEVINVAVHIEEAESRGVQSVPWIRIGPFEVEGVATPGKLRELAQGVNDDKVFDAWLLETLKAGKRQKFEALVKREPQRIHALARMMRNPEASMAVRLGIGAILEEFRGTGYSEPLVPELAEMLSSDDRLLRADACHFLTLIGTEAVRPFMLACVDDDDPEIRETAEEWLAENLPV